MGHNLQAEEAYLAQKKMERPSSKRGRKRAGVRARLDALLTCRYGCCCKDFPEDMNGSCTLGHAGRYVYNGHSYEGVAFLGLSYFAYRR